MSIALGRKKSRPHRVPLPLSYATGRSSRASNHLSTLTRRTPNSRECRRRGWSLRVTRRRRIYLSPRRRLYACHTSLWRLNPAVHGAERARAQRLETVDVCSDRRLSLSVCRPHATDEYFHTRTPAAFSRDQSADSARQFRYDI